MENFFSRVINTFDQLDQIAETQLYSEEYLTFFTTHIDNLSSILSGDVFAHFEDECYYENDSEYTNKCLNDDNTYLESTLMANEDKNVLKICTLNEINDPDIELIEYIHLNEFFEEKMLRNTQYLDKITILHNLRSLSKLENNQKLWLYQNVRKMDVSNSSYILRWLLGQSSKKIIPCVILTIESALQPEMFQDPEIKQYLECAIDGINKLLSLYPNNEELINTKILIKSKM